MKKTLCYALLTVMLLFSLTGCLGDDYEALLLEIEDLEGQIDDAKDEADEISPLITSASASIKQIKSDISGLEDESEALDAEIENYEEIIDNTSDTGLGITKAEFMYACNALIDYGDLFEGLRLYSGPIQYYNDDSQLVLSYSLYYDGEFTDLNNIYIVMASDNIHIESLYLRYNYEYLTTGEDNYLAILSVAFIMAKEQNYDFDSFDLDIYSELIEWEPIYNDTVQLGFEIDNEDVYYIIADIS